MPYMPGFRFLDLGVFPIVEATNTSTSLGSADPSTHAVALPAGIQAGELLLILFVHRNADANVNTPSGWGRGFDFNFDTGDPLRLLAFHKIATGSEGASVNVTVSGQTGVISAHNTYRISSVSNAIRPEYAGAGASTGASPDAPLLSPSWGNGRNMWLAWAGRDINENLTAPASYTDILNAGITNAGSGVTASSARRRLEAASQNPGAFGGTTSSAWAAATIAILGADGVPLTGNDSFTKILLPFEGSLTDTNVGGSAHTWTANGPAAVTSSDSKIGFGSLGIGNNADSQIETGAHADFNLGSSDFTIDFWVKRGTGGTLTAINGLCAQGDTSFTNANSSFGIYHNSTGVLTAGVVQGTTFTQVGATGSITGSVWHHVALIRNGGTLVAAIDGVLGTPTAIAGSVNSSTANFQIGRFLIGGGPFGLQPVSFDEFRLSVGVAHWTANFTPPTLPYG